jgi:hypothetical protein
MLRRAMYTTLFVRDQCKGPEFHPESLEFVERSDVAGPSGRLLTTQRATVQESRETCPHHARPPPLLGRWMSGESHRQGCAVQPATPVTERLLVSATS